MNESYLKLKNHLEQSIEVKTDENFNSLTKLKRAVIVRKLVYIIGYNMMLISSINMLHMVHGWTGFMDSHLNLTITVLVGLVISAVSFIFVVIRAEQFEMIYRDVRDANVSINEFKSDILMIYGRYYPQDMISIKVLDDILNNYSHRNKHS